MYANENERIIEKPIPHTVVVAENELPITKHSQSNKMKMKRLVEPNHYKNYREKLYSRGDSTNDVVNSFLQ